MEKNEEWPGQDRRAAWRTRRIWIARLAGAATALLLLWLGVRR